MPHSALDVHDDASAHGLVFLDTNVAAQEGVVRDLMDSNPARRVGQPLPAKLYFAINAQGEFIHVSELMARFLRRRREELLGMRASEMVNPGEPRHEDLAAVCSEAQAHPGVPYAIAGHMTVEGRCVEIAVASVYWSAASQVWMFECELPDGEYARMNMGLAVPQFPDSQDGDPLRLFIQERNARRLRDQIHAVVQQELFAGARIAAQPKRRAPSSRGHDLSKTRFDEALRQALREICDPDNFDKLTVTHVYRDKIGMSRNAFAGYLIDYGYAQRDEKPTRTLKRLAREWFPEWVSS